MFVGRGHRVRGVAEVMKTLLLFREDHLALWPGGLRPERARLRSYPNELAAAEDG
jgi:hypothetical protein